MAGSNIISKLFGKADSSLNKAFIDGLNPLYGGLLRSIPIVGFDHLSQAIYDAYCKSDILYTIINKKAKAASRTKFGVYRMKSLKAYKGYEEYSKKQDARLDVLLEMKEAAVEPMGHFLNEKFQDPNEEMSQSEYLENLVIFLNATGNCYEYQVLNGNNPLQFHVMPSNLMQILPNGELIPQAAGYQITGVSNKIFDLEEIIHAKYSNPRWTVDGKQLYGMSPIEVLWNLLQADEEGNDAVAEQRKNRGPRKLVGIKNDKIKDYLEGKKMSEELKANFNERMRDSKDRTAAIWGEISTHDMSMMSEAKDMAQSSANFFQRACGVFNVHPHWVMSLQSEAKYSNLEQYNKQSIINGVFPDLNRIRDARNRKFRKLNVIKNSQVIEYDESVYTELDVDKAEMWKWLKDAPFSEDEKRIYLGEKETKKPGMDEVLVPTNKRPISQIYNNGKQNQQNDSQASQGTGGTGESQGGESGK